MNMGATAAPAVKESSDAPTGISGEVKYDRIITGDRTVGQKILIDLLLKDGYDIGRYALRIVGEIFDAGPGMPGQWPDAAVQQ